MSDPLQLFLELELEARIVGIVVAASADLQDHAAITLVGQRQDRTRPARIGGDVGSPGTVATLAADSAQGLAATRKAPGGFEARGVTALALRAVGPLLGCQRFECSRVWRLLPERELSAVTIGAGP